MGVHTFKQDLSSLQLMGKGCLIGKQKPGSHYQQSSHHLQYKYFIIYDYSKKRKEPNTGDIGCHDLESWHES